MQPVGRSVPGNRLMASGRSVMALVLREMASTSGRSVLGYLWAVLEPIAVIALLTFIFSLLFRAPPLGTSFPIFYATGLLPFLLYMDVSMKVSQSIRFSRPLLFYPRLTFVDALVARFLLSFLTQVVVFCVVVVGLLELIRSNVVLHIPSILVALAMVGALSLGVGTMNCFLMSRFPAWERVWSIANRPMFIISGIFFTFESAPRAYQDILWYNPIIHVTGQMRTGFYPTYEAPYVSSAYVLGLAFALLAGGLVFLKRFHRDLVNP